MDQAARVFFHPDFHYPYPLFPPVEHDVYGGVFSQLHRIPGQRVTRGCRGGGKVDFPWRFPDNGAPKPPDEQAGFPGGLEVQNRDGAGFVPAYRAGRTGAAGAKGFRAPVSGVFSQEYTHFQGNMGFVQGFTSKSTNKSLEKKTFQ
jgi:hypothetical protein